MLAEDVDQMKDSMVLLVNVISDIIETKMETVQNHPSYQNAMNMRDMIQY